jgi:hypothetical protein
VLHCVLGVLYCVGGVRPLQVYRGKWCDVEIAAKEYLAVDDDGETEWTQQVRVLVFRSQRQTWQSSMLPRQSKLPCQSAS